MRKQKSEVSFKVGDMLIHKNNDYYSKRYVFFIIIIEKTINEYKALLVETFNFQYMILDRNTIDGRYEFITDIFEGVHE